MPAYVILDVKVTDRELYEEYKSLSGPAMTPYGGRFLIRGGSSEVLEGDWRPHRMVVLEFPDIEKARAWWNSPEYAEPKKLRQGASRGNMILVDGV